MKSPVRSLVVLAAMLALVLGSGCVANRPSRNGVFDENQYIRKAFLTTDGTHPDPGWFLKATVTQVSTPNPLGALGIFPGADTGFGTGLGYVQFVVTSDKLQMVNMRQISSVSSPDNTPEVINAWPVTNVDLKYQVNLDGETTNFYQENQELDWQVRQWVKINLDKNDMSDAAPLGYFVTNALEKCTDIANASATLVPNSFTTEEYPDWTKDYMSWQVQISAPLNFGDAACAEAFSQGASGASSAAFGRNYVTFTLMYSLMRVKDVEDPATNPSAYVPLVLDEKDPIRHKYGLFEIIPVSRDPSSNLLAARELVTRWNPLKPVTYYFASDVPYNIKDAFLGHRQYDSIADQALDVGRDCSTPGCQRAADGIEALTNDVMQKAGNTTFQVDFLNWNDATKFGDRLGPSRQYGDVRYSFVHYVPDIDANTGWLGYGPSASDPRTGEILNATVNIADSEANALAYQIDFFLGSLGVSQGLGYTSGGAPAEWPSTPPGLSGSCTPGQTVPLDSAVVGSRHNGPSSLFQDIQQYMGKPVATYGNLGPGDFIPPQDPDFLSAYYTLIPYVIYADPNANAFVIPEGGAGINGPANFWDLMAKEAQFHSIASQIDHGVAPYQDVTGPDGIQNATAFIDNWRSLTQNHADLQYAKLFVTRQQVWDPVNAMSIVQIADHASRHCTADPGGGAHWETKEEWTTNLINSFYEQISIHEFGHTLGLEHNFMGSIDQPNFPVKTDPSDGMPILDANGNPEYTLYTNSVMEYTARMGDVFDVLQWGPYDRGALGWAYTNNAPKPVDPQAAPAKSVTGQIDAQTPWNDPLGFKADGTENVFMSCHDVHLRYTPLCRQFDMGATPSEIMANQIETYDWTWNFNNFRVYRKFWDDSAYADKPANLLVDMRRFLLLWAFDWNSGEITDTLRRIGFKAPANVPALQYYSQLENKFDLELSTANQLMATFHKAIIQQSTGQRPTTTIYDQFYGDVTQQGIILDKLFAMEFFVGLWPSSSLYDQNQAGAYFTSYGNALDPAYESVAEDTVNSMVGGQYDAFPYFAPLAVALFAQDTHSFNFSGAIQVRNWIGGHVFTRVEDFVNYFRNIAAQNDYPGCPSFDSPTCTYDPRTVPDPTQHNEFFGPDNSRWIWAYIPDRNEYVAVQKDINVAAYVIVRNYNDDLVNQLDDGAFPGGAYADELQMKYYLDSFTQYN